MIRQNGKGHLDYISLQMHRGKIASGLSYIAHEMSQSNSNMDISSGKEGQGVSLL